MVKKKTTESEFKNENINTETPDIKNDTGAAKEDKNEQTELSSEGTADGRPSKTEPCNGAPTDKVVPGDDLLKEKVAEIQDRYLRLSAEFDNYRKRTLKEKMEISKYAGEDLIKKILPLMDDFERALKHMDDTPDSAGVKEGVALIFTKFSEFFKQQNVTEIEALNLDFNVDVHEAVAKTPVAEEEKKGKIVDVVLKGYYLKDKVIRHSKVVIGE